HTCYEYLRLKYPQRHNLKNKLRYVLTHLPGLALWENKSGDLVAGFDAWRGQTRPRTRGNRLLQLLDNPRTALQSALRPEDFGRTTPSNLADLAAAAFNHTDHPIELDDLVGIVAGLLSVKDQTENSDAHNPGADQFAGIADERA